MTQVIQEEHIAQAMSYAAYRQLITQLLAENKTTGTNQEESLVMYAKLNNQRMNRLDKTFTPTTATVEKVKEITENQIWLVLTEGWCGDAAQSVPILNKIAQANAKIDLKILLRDEHLDVMDAFLTNGGRSIPKLICLQAATLEVLWDWGPRPAVAQKMVMDYKASPTGPYEAFVETIHMWYTKDKGANIQQEIIEKIDRQK
ncbi:MAG: thioredoxin family protein [Thermonemataceae bacterium]